MVATATEPLASRTQVRVGADPVVDGQAQAFTVEVRELTAEEEAASEALARRDLATALVLDLGVDLGGTVREAAKPTSQLANNVETQNRRTQERELDLAQAIERNSGGGIHPAVIQAMMNQTSIPTGAVSARNLSGRIYA